MGVPESQEKVVACSHNNIFGSFGRTYNSYPGLGFGAFHICNFLKTDLDGVIVQSCIISGKRAVCRSRYYTAVCIIN